MDVFESGEYGFHIINSETKPTKKGDGTMLIFTAECLDPEHRKKRLLIRLNLVNPSQQAVEIAYRDLSAICHVTGVLQIQDTQQLHGKPFRVRIEKIPRQDDPTKFGNEIRGYMDMNGKGPGEAGSVAPAAPQAPAAPAQQAAPAPAAPAAAPAPAQQPWQQPATAPAAAPAPNGAAPWAQQPAAPAAAPAGTPPWAQNG